MTKPVNDAHDQSPFLTKILKKKIANGQILQTKFPRCFSVNKIQTLRNVSKIFGWHILAYSGNKLTLSFWRKNRQTVSEVRVCVWGGGDGGKVIMCATFNHLLHPSIKNHVTHEYAIHKENLKIEQA